MTATNLPEAILVLGQFRRNSQPGFDSLRSPGAGILCKALLRRSPRTFARPRGPENVRSSRRAFQSAPILIRQGRRCNCHDLACHTAIIVDLFSCAFESRRRRRCRNYTRDISRFETTKLLHLSMKIPANGSSGKSIRIRNALYSVLPVRFFRGGGGGGNPAVSFSPRRPKACEFSVRN